MLIAPHRFRKREIRSCRDESQRPRPGEERNVLLVIFQRLQSGGTEANLTYGKGGIFTETTLPYGQVSIFRYSEAVILLGETIVHKITAQMLYQSCDVNKMK